MEPSEGNNIELHARISTSSNERLFPISFFSIMRLGFVIYIIDGGKKFNFEIGNEKILKEINRLKIKQNWYQFWIYATLLFYIQIIIHTGSKIKHLNSRFDGKSFCLYNMNLRE